MKNIKQKAILFGPFIGELGWEILRFAPMLKYYKQNKYNIKNDIKYIILTRQDRFDLYGKNANILLPLNIENDYDKYLPDCFKLLNYPISEYNKIVKLFYNKYKNKYDIINHIYPKLENKQYCNKNQFNKNKMIFEFNPRNDNKKLLDEYLKNVNKKIIILSPRYRKNFKRNWNQWPKLFDLIYNDKYLMDNYEFILCGKEGEYIKDERNRFLDINNIQLNDNTSLIGILLSLMDKSILTIGSQSAIPNLSLLKKIKVIEWGHEKIPHTSTYNIFNTPIIFLEDKKYNLSAIEIFKLIKKELSNVSK
jgi:hypothetical protein